VRDVSRFAPRARHIPDLPGPVNLHIARWRDRIGGFCPTAPPLNMGTGPVWINCAHYIAAGAVIFMLGIFCFALQRNTAAKTATRRPAAPLTLSVMASAGGFPLAEHSLLMLWRPSRLAVDK
jgi:hypothetical protein